MTLENHAAWDATTWVSACEALGETTGQSGTSSLVIAAVLAREAAAIRIRILDAEATEEDKYPEIVDAENATADVSIAAKLASFIAIPLGLQ